LACQPYHYSHKRVNLIVIGINVRVKLRSDDVHDDVPTHSAELSACVVVLSHHALSGGVEDAAGGQRPARVQSNNSPHVSETVTQIGDRRPMLRAAGAQNRSLGIVLV